MKLTAWDGIRLACARPPPRLLSAAPFMLLAENSDPYASPDERANTLLDGSGVVAESLLP
jgi:hypothetical protein